MKRPAIFFDRDNTLIVNDGYLGDPAKVVLVRGAGAAVAAARRMGFATVVVSNQSGVARGLFTEDDVRKVNARMDAMLVGEDPAAVIDRHEYCPFHPKAKIEAYRKESDLRKPKPGMLLNAAKLLNVDLHQSWMIGDTPRDLEAGRAAGCRTILFSDPNLSTSPDAGTAGPVYADYVVSKLADAMEFIGRNRIRPDESELPSDEAAIASLPRMNEPINPPNPAASTHPPTSPNLARSATRPAAASPASGSIAGPSSALAPDAPADTSAANPQGTKMGTAPDSLAEGSAVSAQAGPAIAPIDPLLAGIQIKPPVSADVTLSRIESLLRELVTETRRRNELDLHADFSVIKVLAGIAQVVSIAVLFFAYLNRADQSSLTLLLVAVVLQLLTISLTIMGRQK